MPDTKNKFLVDLIHGISTKQAFFLFWGGMVAGFVALMYAHYKKYTRSNFRSPGDDGPPLTRIDARRLPDGTDGKKVVPRDNTPAGKTGRQ